MIIPNVGELVSAKHKYRKLLAIVNLTELAKPLRNLYARNDLNFGFAELKFGHVAPWGATNNTYTERKTNSLVKHKQAML